MPGNLCKTPCVGVKGFTRALEGEGCEPRGEPAVYLAGDCDDLSMRDTHRISFVCCWSWTSSWRKVRALVIIV